MGIMQDSKTDPQITQMTQMSDTYAPDTRTSASICVHLRFNGSKRPTVILSVSEESLCFPSFARRDLVSRARLFALRC